MVPSQKGVANAQTSTDRFKTSIVPIQASRDLLEDVGNAPNTLAIPAKNTGLPLTKVGHDATKVRIAGENSRVAALW